MGKLIKSLVIVLSMMMVFGLLAACASPSPAETPAEASKEQSAEKPADEPASAEEPADPNMPLKGIVVGFSQMENNMPFRIAETNSVIEEAEKRGVELIYTDAQSSTSKQISDVEDLIAQGVDYLIVVPREYEGMEETLKKAQEKGIKVIQSSTRARGYFETFIGADFTEEGRKAAKWLGDRMEGKGNVVELVGIPGGNVAQERQAGFMEVLGKDYPDMKVIASQTANFTRAEGQSVMENIIQTHGTDINAVYAHNDEMALGAIQALKAAGMEPGKDVVIISIDGQKDAVAAVAAGELNCTIECPPKKGPACFDAIEALERGEKLPEFTKVEGQIFDEFNIQDHIGEGF